LSFSKIESNGQQIDIFVNVIKTPMTPQQWIQTLNYKVGKFSPGPIPNSLQTQSETDVHFKSEYTFVQNNGYIFNIEMDEHYPTDYTTEELATYNQIVSTFKFLSGY